MHTHSRRVLATLLVLAAPVLAGCAESGGQEGGEGGATSAVTADLLGSGEKIAARTQSAAQPGTVDDTPVGPIDLDVLGFDSGDADAPVQVVEFTDFGCGYCRRFHLNTWPTLEEQFVETGKAVWKFVPMELGMFGPNSVTAAEAAECTIPQGHFPAMRTALFERQGDWKGERDPMPILREIAGAAGADLGAWDACMESGERKLRVRQGTAMSRRAGVRGTPTFFIVGFGQIPGAVETKLFVEVMDTVYAQATARVGSGG